MHVLLLCEQLYKYSFLNIFNAEDIKHLNKLLYECTNCDTHVSGPLFCSKRWHHNLGV